MRKKPGQICWRALRSAGIHRVLLLAGALFVCELYLAVLIVRKFYPHHLAFSLLIPLAVALLVISAWVSAVLVCRFPRTERSLPTPSSRETYQLIASYREAFRTAPLGAWSQAVGSFSEVMDEYWDFRPDHTGVMISTGPFGYKRSELQFAWCEVADFTIACREVRWIDYDKDEQNDFDNDEEEWWVIRYDFTLVQTEYGCRVAMCEMDEDGTPQRRFWLSQEPLELQSGPALVDGIQ